MKRWSLNKSKIIIMLVCFLFVRFNSQLRGSAPTIKMSNGEALAAVTSLGADLSPLEAAAFVLGFKAGSKNSGGGSGAATPSRVFKLATSEEQVHFEKLSKVREPICCCT
jgi:hypothetical protein